MALLKVEAGCKVGWHTWSTRAEAEADSVKQRDEAARKWQRGYDFGYCVPGEIREQLLHDDLRKWGADSEVVAQAGETVFVVTTP